MIRAACHCTAVRMEITRTPQWVFDCNCSICARYGTLWAYYRPGEVVLVSGEDQTEAYLWGDKAIAFHHCRTCGCLTHHSVVGADPPHIRGVNARMMPTLDPASVKLQQTDNAKTGFFWTRPPDKFQPGEQPPVASDGWR